MGGWVNGWMGGRVDGWVGIDRQLIATITKI